MNENIKYIIKQLESVEAEIDKVSLESFADKIYVAAAGKNVRNAIGCLKETIKQ